MKALIWDLDGTLVDSYGIMTDIIYKVMKGKIEKEKIYEIIKTSSVSYFFYEQALAQDTSQEYLFSLYHDFHNQIKLSDYNLIKGVKEVLEATAQQGYTHYIYTHRGHSTFDILKSHDILDYFKDIITIDDGFARKPSPDALKYLIDKHHLDKKTSYYIGDRSLDVICANEAGIHSVYFDNFVKNEDANYSISDLSQVLAILSS